MGSRGRGRGGGSLRRAECRVIVVKCFVVLYCFVQPVTSISLGASSSTRPTLLSMMMERSGGVDHEEETAILATRRLSSRKGRLPPNLCNIK